MPEEQAGGADLVAGRFRIEGLLGSGGGGIVYAVCDQRTLECLALKRLHERGEDASPAIARFQREYHTLSQLRHPHIVEVRDYGVDASGPYYTMELLDGDDLRAVAPLPWREVCRLLRQAASALALLHARRLLHRDLSPRNVRVTASGAKLMDFGSLATFGVTGVAGTPACIPPEAVHGQPLDPRSDMYGLGALAYWLLTGTHAYPARRAVDLLDVWRSVPRAPSHLAPGVPEALDVLVMQLLKLSPIGRPGSAAEVIDRLGRIADLPPLPASASVRSYISSAALVGRADELTSLRKRVLRAVQGRGSATAIEGPPGIGKTRLLQALQLEGKLGGAVVVRVEARSCGRAAFDVARAMLQQLLDVAPETTLIAARNEAPVLVHLVDELRASLGQRTPATLPDDAVERRGRLQAALLSTIQSFARRRTTVLSVDDLQLADDASVGLVGLLAKEAPHLRLMLAVTLPEPADARLDLAALRNLCAVCPLGGLDGEALRTLVQTWFGDVPYVERLSKAILELTAGNPLEATELARHLVERGTVRHVDGAWVLPEKLEHDDLPRSLGEVLGRRLEGLSPHARRLGELLAVAGGRLPLDLYHPLFGGGDQEAFAAVDQLVIAGLLVGAGDTYDFPQRGITDAFLRRVDATRRVELHLRIGRALLARGVQSDHDRLDVGMHLLRGGDPRGAEMLADAGLRLIRSESAPVAVAALEAALQAFEGEGRSIEQVLDIRVALTLAAYYWDPRLMHHADRAIEGLRQASGLSGATRLQRFVGPRAGMWLGWTGAAMRRHATPAERRGPHVSKALSQLAICASYAAGMAAVTTDRDRALRIQSALAPLKALPRTHGIWAGLHVVDRLANMLCGHHREAWRLGEQLLEELEVPHMYPQLNAEQRRDFRAGVLLSSGFIAAICADEEALRKADALATVGRHTDAMAAVQVRLLYYLYRGDHGAFLAQRKELESLALHLGSLWHIEIWLPSVLAAGHDFLRDAMGLKQSMALLEARAAQEPSFRPSLLYARGAYLRERGDHAGAKASLEEALAQAPLGEHVVAASAATALAETLLEMGEVAEARALASRAVAVLECTVTPRSLQVTRLAIVLATIQAREGHLAKARARLAEQLQLRSNGDGAVNGVIQEALARIAIHAGDEHAFREHGLAAAQIFAASGNPALVARSDRLALEARRAGIKPPSDMVLGGSVESLMAANANLVARFRALFDTCTSDAERYERALEIIAQHASADHGYFFGPPDTGTELLARWRASTPPAALRERIHLLLEEADGVSVTEDEDITETEMEQEWIASGEDGGLAYRPLLVRTHRQGAPWNAGVVALAREEGALKTPDFEMVRAVADALALSVEAQPPEAEPKTAAAG